MRIIQVNWSAYQFHRSDKKDRSSWWRSANSTSCCLMLTACTSTSNCRMRFIGPLQPLDILGTDVTVSCSPLPSRRLPGRVIRKRLYAQAVQQRCAHEKVFMNECRSVLARLQAYTLRLWWTQTLRIKLRTLVSHYVFDCRCCWW